jgi:hypothetical protein
VPKIHLAIINSRQPVCSRGELPIIYDIHLPQAHCLVHNQSFIQEEKYYQNPPKLFIHEDTISF